MEQNKKTLKNLSELAGWVSLAAFILGVLTWLSDRDLFFSGNDYWQASLYLALFAIFATLKAKN